MADELPWHIITDGWDDGGGGASPSSSSLTSRLRQQERLSVGLDKRTASEEDTKGRTRRGDYQDIWFYSAMAVWDKTTVIPVLSPPLNYPPHTDTDNTKVLIVKAREGGSYTDNVDNTNKTVCQRNLWRTQYSTHMFCKQNVQGTNAWLWYMCNRVVLVYSYSMNLIFLLVAFSFRKTKSKKNKKKNKKKSGC